MATSSSILSHFLHLLLFLASTSLSSSDEPRTYIIHVERPPPDHAGTHREWHQSFLPNSTSLLFSYRHVVSGFAAAVTPPQLEAIRSADGFVHAEPNRVHSLQTTHTPSFLGLHRTFPLDSWRRAFNFGRGVIIGLLDTGISPAHPSFHDAGMPPPPAKWKGECKFSPVSLCNNKLIGARSFKHGHETTSPLDDFGHGTHTASTAAGRFVANASVLGSALGTAAGIAPEAHVAMYKVCNATTCETADILAGIDSAIADGVDVISMSIVGAEAPLFEDLAPAALAAVRSGVFFAASAGNDGPWSGSVTNTAPWMLTVGAATTDRRIRAVVSLGNGLQIEGQSAYQPNMPGCNSSRLPLVSSQFSIYCVEQKALELAGVGGKIVLCMDGDGLMTSVEKTELVRRAGASGLILVNPRWSGYETYAGPYYLPTSHVSFEDGLAIAEYINSTADPTAAIAFDGTVIGGHGDPAVSAFSGRGPSRASPGILKPDILGPGANVLAAWPEPVGPFPVDPPFNILSGTSMSCPHLAGVAALLRAAHPDWSPAAIKSAIMTTADVENLGGGPILDMQNKAPARVDDIGAGHVNPVRAGNPGLVYDIRFEDYVAYLCTLNYTDAQVSVIAHDNVGCSARYGGSEWVDLNYPSFAVSLDKFNNWTRVARRVVTNVGERRSSYRVEVERRPFGVTVRVDPDTLEFGRVGEERRYAVGFGINATEMMGVVGPVRTDGLLRWVSSDGKVVVRSPLVVDLLV